MSINVIDCLYGGCPKALMEEMLKCDDLWKYEIQDMSCGNKAQTWTLVVECTYLEEDDDIPVDAIMIIYFSFTHKF